MWTDYIPYIIYVIEAIVIFVVTLALKLKNKKLKKQNKDDYNSFTGFVELLMSVKTYIVEAEKNKHWTGKEKLDYVTKMVKTDAEAISYDNEDIKKIVSYLIEFTKRVNYTEKEEKENGKPADEINRASDTHLA